jgi:hypothetical protein
LTAFDQRCPGALLSSDDYGSSVERTAKLHPLWQAQLSRPGVSPGDARWAAMQLMEGRYELMEDLSVGHVQPRGLGRPLMTRHPVVATRAVTAVQARCTPPKRRQAHGSSGASMWSPLDVESSYRIEPAIPSSGEDLCPRWQTAWYLPRSTRTSPPPRSRQRPRGRVVLPIFIPQGWPQAMNHLPSMRRHFERPYQTSCTRTFAQANGAATSWFVGRREVGCSAVSGKSLARKLFRSPNTEGGLSRCST